MQGEQLLTHPYQIYSEISNVGKTFAGSKKSIKWRFGWSNSQVVTEVEFVHSAVSGKKKVLENGRKVSEGEATMGADYTYGWNSYSAKNHIFRIEAALGLTDQTYYFSIDGLNFNEFPREPVQTRTPLHTPLSPSHGAGSNNNQFGSGNKNKIIPRGNFQSPGTNNDSWDDNNNGTGGGRDSFSNSDPFGDRPSQPINNNNRVGNNNSSNSFDPFGDEDASFEGSDRRGGNVPVAEAVAVNTNAGAKKNTQSQQQKPVVAAAPTVNLLDDQPIPVVSARKNYLDDFSSFSNSAGSPGRQSNGGGNGDIFSVLNDPFAPKAVIVGSNAFSGNNNNTNNNANNNTAQFGAIKLNDTSASGNNNDLDILDHATRSLVSLDLNANNKPASKTRKEEYEKNLPLNTLMGVTGGGVTGKAAVMTPDPVMQPAMRVLSPSESISSMGAMPPRPMMMMGGGQPQMMTPYGTGPQNNMMMMGGQQQQQFQQQPMMMGGGMGMQMQQQPMGGGGMMSMPMQQQQLRPLGVPQQYGSYGQAPLASSSTSSQTTKKTTNALDSLEWKM